MNAIQFEETLIHFKSDVFAAVAVSMLNLHIDSRINNL